MKKIQVKFKALFTYLILIILLMVFISCLIGIIHSYPQVKFIDILAVSTAFTSYLIYIISTLRKTK